MVSHRHMALASRLKGPSHCMLFHTVVETSDRRGDSMEFRIAEAFLFAFF